ncbi:vacuolar import and degradation protein-domain-containing protein [Xylaria longipes]|nr:vacuolar import and degradation protein-domain-containing protein [Xylaria longipes]
MPTPSSNLPPTPPELPPRTHSSSCPEDVRSPSSWSPDEDGLEMNLDIDATTSPGAMSAPTAEVVELLTESRSTTESPRPDSRSGTDRSASEPVDIDSPSHKPTEELGEVQGAAIAAVAAAERHRPRCDLDTATTEHDKLEDDDGRVPINHDEYEPSMGFDYSNVRIFPLSPSSFLRPGSKFHGTQQSERQVYDVQVEIKYVDLRESFLCGYLRIQGMLHQTPHRIKYYSVLSGVYMSVQPRNYLALPSRRNSFANHGHFIATGLTEDNPTLTTYFEGEIIGSRYDFLTKHEGWGATEKIDLNHWGKFSAFRQYSKQVRKGVAVTIPNLAQRENIFMRWKEHFLVPDHRVTSINGASFEGFYYICFNQKEGSVSGIYFHSKSEKFQQLELKHVEDRGCFSALEFR